MLMTDREIAQVTYEVNRAYCQSLGDHSFGPWDAAPAWQQDANTHGVTFHRANSGAHPAASHESWLEAKRVDGWVYGPVKDPERKQHPCMVPYDELPAEQRAKDFLFIGVMRALA